jgi:hypothetical protein
MLTESPDSKSYCISPEERVPFFVLSGERLSDRCPLEEFSECSVEVGDGGFDASL